MITETLITLFHRDLTKLKSELELYTDESTIWKVDKEIANSAGNLTLHLIGNLKHFIGTVLGKSGYIRQRDLEFSLKNIPRIELLKQLDETIEVIGYVLPNLKTEDLQLEYPVEVFGKPMTTEYFLIHLATHLGYHLGQVNYHRRLLG